MNKPWQVHYDNLAYDGGGASSWNQYYRTWIGAKCSMWIHLHIRSWGGHAELIDNRKLRKEN